nr:unnamed protein product [Callosobruchus analis]CAI5836325.1 unnamed protein product [Callosobruchus analis]CAI5861845.1 unnamed protein product [Callosobruchus analis]
MNIRGC